MNALRRLRAEQSVMPLWTVAYRKNLEKIFIWDHRRKQSCDHNSAGKCDSRLQARPVLTKI